MSEMNLSSVLPSAEHQTWVFKLTSYQPSDLMIVGGNIQELLDLDYKLFYGKLIILAFYLQAIVRFLVTYFSQLKMSTEEEENAAELKIGEEFLKAKCLMNCEVALILDKKYEQLQNISDDPMSQTSQVFEKSLQYVKRFSRYKNSETVKQVREVLSRNRLAEFELCVLGNLCPETVEEAIAMVPTIKTKGRFEDDDAIEKMLHDLSLIKKFE